MKNVNFEKLVIQNFMSVGGEEITIEFKQGLNFITGFNKDNDSYNGVGKTTLINAFFFALFGTLYGDNSGKLKKSDIINNVLGGIPTVNLYFTVDKVDYRITRTVNPSNCKLTIDGEDKNQQASIAETNKAICKIISGDSEVYSNTIVMDSDTSSFLLKKPEQKRKFIESVLGLGIFSAMLKSVKSDFTKKNAQFSTEKTKLGELENHISREESNEEGWGDKQENRIKEVLAEVVVLIDKKTQLENAAPSDPSEKIKELQEKIEAVSQRILKGEGVKVKTETKIQITKAEIAAAKKRKVSPDSLSCPSCKRPYDDHNQADIDAENAKIDDEVATLNQSLSESEDMLNKIAYGIITLTANKVALHTEVDEYNRQLVEFNSIDTQISACDVELKAKNDRVKELEKETNPFTDSIDNLKKLKTTAVATVEAVEIEVEVLNYVKYLCSPEGVKAHIIKKIVELFNAKLNYYLKVLGAPCTLKFDEFFEATITNATGADVSYHSLSGGERKRVDLSMLFAFKDIRRMQSNISVNVTMLDELLDSAICSVGTEKSLEILKDGTDKNAESVFIITHKMDQVDESTGNILYLEKENGITRKLDKV